MGRITNFGGLYLIPSLHLALGVKLWLHLPDVVVSVIQEVLLYVLCLLAKHAVQRPVGDEWLCEQLFLEL